MLLIVVPFYCQKQLHLSAPDPLIHTFPRMLLETPNIKLQTRKGRKAPGSCGVYPEYILHGGTEALRTLHSIFSRVQEKVSYPRGMAPRYNHFTV